MLPGKRENLNRVTVEFSEWSDDIEVWKDKIPFDNPVGFKDWLFRENSAGRVKLASLKLDGNAVGFLAFRIVCLEKRELFVEAVYCEDKTIDWFDYVERLTTELAKRYGCASKSLSTIRGGMVSRLLERGYRIAEVTLRKDIL